MKTEFYSLEKLLEFGLPANAANNMIDSMNQVFDTMRTPGVDNATTDNISTWTEDLYFAVLDGEKSGPYTLVEVARLIVDKRITKNSYLWKPGMSKWNYADTFPEVLRLVAIDPPEVPPMGLAPIK